MSPICAVNLVSIERLSLWPVFQRSEGPGKSYSEGLAYAVYTRELSSTREAVPLAAVGLRWARSTADQHSHLGLSLTLSASLSP